jgi:hypothetical protein
VRSIFIVEIIGRIFLFYREKKIPKISEIFTEVVSPGKIVKLFYFSTINGINNANLLMPVHRVRTLSTSLRVDFTTKGMHKKCTVTEASIVYHERPPHAARNARHNNSWVVEVG